VQVFTKQIDASLTWEFVAWLRTVTRLPIYVKVGAHICQRHPCCRCCQHVAKLLHTFTCSSFRCRAACCRVCWLRLTRSLQCEPEWMASYSGAHTGLQKETAARRIGMDSAAGLPVVFARSLNDDRGTPSCEVTSCTCSNHGGRQCDCVPAAVEMLPHVIDAIGHVVPLIVDGGIRRGTDVLKVAAGL
jgi:FMN-dependent dehydrogenase